ncbi:hypothetical protein BDV41DRAFT_552024 [Aspergillus transmontanensis]|uniref:Uncharacterized protein n=1 Tax=Aspergillus transmontanensis TaxID=1034304 RepID=A0A5N6VMC0_9EURO|nr:hypothetical protein BDV41DRAFT_552024 [Aspergillus transmontanensis]
MEWMSADEWPDHCRTHLQSWTTRHCEIVTYRYTVIRPGYCPFCLWDEKIPKGHRMQDWIRTDGLRQHMEREHISCVQLSYN